MKLCLNTICNHSNCHIYFILIVFTVFTFHLFITEGSYNVTPLQTSKGNNRYFNYTVQYERNEFAGGVLFLLEKRKLFVRAQEEQPPIQLKLVKKLQSKPTSTAAFNLKVCHL